MTAWMKANVVVRNPDTHLVETFTVGTARQDMPAWAVEAITNPDAWTDTRPPPPPPTSGPCGQCGAHVPPLRPYLRIDGALVCLACADRLQPSLAGFRAVARQVCADADAARLLRDALGDEDAP